LPGAGGTQRVPRLIGVMAAAKLLTDGNPISPAEAKKLGLVHELAPTAEVVARARAWLLGTPEAVAPWDKKGFRIPGGGNSLSPAVTQTMLGGTALIAKMTLRNYPAPRKFSRLSMRAVPYPSTRVCRSSRSISAACSLARCHATSCVPCS